MLMYKHLHKWKSNILKIFLFHIFKCMLVLQEITFLGLPWWSSGKESTLQCRVWGFDLWSGNQDPTCYGATKPGHHNYWAPVPQLESLCAINYRAHVLWNPRTTTTEPTCPEASAPQRETPAPQWRACVPQWKIPHASKKIPRAATKTRYSPK